MGYPVMLPHRPTAKMPNQEHPIGLEPRSVTGSAGGKESDRDQVPDAPSSAISVAADSSLNRSTNIHSSYSVSYGVLVSDTIPKSTNEPTHHPS